MVNCMSDYSEQARLLKYLNEDAFKLLGDETRRRIIFLLRDSELSVKELSSELKLTVQNIYHHIRRLQEAGLIRVTEERRTGHLTESYYTVTADTFIYNEDRMVERSMQSSVDILNGLNEMGVGVEVSEENAVRLSQLHAKEMEMMDSPSVTNDMCTFCSFSGYFMKFGPMNPVLLSQILQYANLMDMTEEEFEASLDLSKNLRSFLLSIKNE
jgi:DNA-binding transcriptional ArsR family regulator